MKERQGRLARTVGALADSLASAQRSRGGRPGVPRVVVYDGRGQAVALRPGTAEHEQIVDVADRMIGLWRESEPGPDAPES
jgi:hypothetical protein